MTIILIGVLAVLLALNLRISKSLLYPPSLFAAVWLVSVIALYLSGDYFFSLSLKTILVYVVGAVSFSVGGWLVQADRNGEEPRFKQFSEARCSRIRATLDGFLIVLTMVFPLYWAYVVKDRDIADPLFFASLRAAATESVESSIRTFSVVSNLSVLAIVTALAMHFENDGSPGRKWKTWFATAIAIIYGSLTGSKMPLVTLALAAVFISCMKARKSQYAKIGVYATVAMVLFGLMLLIVNFAYLDLDFSFQSFEFLASTIRSYWLGGLVAFERIVQDPNAIESVQNLNRFFLETANGFGAHFYIPSLHAEYTPISSYDITNVYTLYFSYFKDYGWLGVVLGLSVLGGLLTWNYRLALKGYPIAVVVYGMNAVGILLSIYAENFVLALNFYTKLLIFLFLVYYGVSRLTIRPPAPRRFRHA